MDIEEAKNIAAEAKRKRELDAGYSPSPLELQAIDLVLIEQARERLKAQRSMP